MFETLFNWDFATTQPPRELRLCRLQGGFMDGTTVKKPDFVNENILRVPLPAAVSFEIDGSLQMDFNNMKYATYEATGTAVCIPHDGGATEVIEIFRFAG